MAIELEKEIRDIVDDKVDRSIEEIKEDIKGDKGDEGDKGKKGDRGEKGDKGKEGKRGKAGERGKMGHTGPTGDKGDGGVKGDKGDDGSPDSAEDIRNKLELLEDKERLRIEAIHDLREELDKLGKIRSRGGGGVSAIGVRQAFKMIAHTETPAGDIDGDNVTYTVKKNIFWIAGFMLNGEQIGEAPNFTYAGRTITFSTALPAAYSGRDFEIKYIG